MTGEHTALIAFSATNVRPYRKRIEISLDALRTGNPNIFQEIETSASKPIKVLPAVGFFGANASGKTAILDAMSDMRKVVIRSFRDDLTGKLRRDFLLGNIENEEKRRQKPSEFHIELVLNGITWLYGFDVTHDQILKEYAYYYPRGKRVLVFERDSETIVKGKQFRSFARHLEPLLNSNRLLLSIIGALNNSLTTDYDIGTKLSNLFRWFEQNLKMVSSGNLNSRYRFTAKHAMSETFRDRIIDLIRFADLGLTDLVVEDVVENDSELDSTESIEEDGITDVRRSKVEQIVRLKHQGMLEDSYFDPIDESLGTKVWVALVGPMLQALDSGSVILVDELDSSLHPELVKEIIDLFQNPKSNVNCAQLIFNSHDLEIMDNGELYAIGRDQIWFTEKDKQGECKLFPLSEFKGSKRDLIRAKYIVGRYGAVPSVNSWLFEPIKASSSIELLTDEFDADMGEIHFDSDK